MDETKELLKASFGRLEGLIGEVKDLRYKIKDVQGNMESLRSALKERPEGEEGGEKGKEGKGNVEGQEQQSGGPSQEDRRGEGGGEGGSDGLGERLSRIERKLAYMGEKWLELDEKIFHLERGRE